MRSCLILLLILGLTSATLPHGFCPYCAERSPTTEGATVGFGCPHCQSNGQPTGDKSSEDGQSSRCGGPDGRDDTPCRCEVYQAPPMLVASATAVTIEPPAARAWVIAWAGLRLDTPPLLQTRSPRGAGPPGAGHGGSVDLPILLGHLLF